jgi:hypothetical protein
MESLKRILPNLLEWSKEDGESYAELDELYGALTGRRYMGHVTKMLGIYDSPKTYDMTGNQFVVVPKVFKRCRCIPEHTIVYYSNLLNQDVLSKLTPIMVLRLSKGCRMRHNQFVSWRPNGPSLKPLLQVKIIILLTS